jgi:hypothetical protein
VKIVVGLAVALRGKESFLAGLHVLAVVVVFDRLSIGRRITALPRAEGAAQGFD